MMRGPLTFKVKNRTVNFKHIPVGVFTDLECFSAADMAVRISNYVAVVSSMSLMPPISRPWWSLSQARASSQMDMMYVRHESHESGTFEVATERLMRNVY
jgi:hypothetical protein